MQQETNKNVDRGLKQLFQQSMKSKVRKLKRYIKENTKDLDSLEQANYVYEQLPDISQEEYVALLSVFHEKTLGQALQKTKVSRAYMARLLNGVATRLGL